MIQDRAALLWVINLGCIDLNQWYATCDDVDRPDYVHFDLDPGAGAVRARARDRARGPRRARPLKMPSVVKTTGSKGLHVYVPIVRGPEQKQCGRSRKALAQELAAATGAHHRRVPRRQAAARRVLVDYNQNRGAARWRRSTRAAAARATVSTPVTWKEIEQGVRIEDFTMKNVPARVRRSATCGSRCLARARPFNLSQFV
jgi:bifunctional non-homologous end joining protein LigD